MRTARSSRPSRASSTSRSDRKTPENGPTVEIELLEPATGVAPGQAAVIYAGTRVVGSATIARTGRRTPA